MLKTQSVRKLTDHRWLNLFEATYQHTGKDGTTKDGKWLFCSRKADPQPSDEPMKPDAVVIVPIVEKDGKQYVAVSREYRVPLGDYEYGVSAGLLEPGESPEDAARRELNEETGLKYEKTLLITSTNVSSAGMSDENVILLFAKASGEPNNDNLDGCEDIVTELYDHTALTQLLNSGKKISGKAYGVFLMMVILGFHGLAFQGTASEDKTQLLLK